MPASADNSNATRTGHHPSFPQESRKSEGASDGKAKTLGRGALNGKMVRLGRERLGWSQEEFSGKSNRDVKTIQNVESGRTKKPATLRLLCDILESELENSGCPNLDRLLNENAQQRAEPPLFDLPVHLEIGAIKEESQFTDPLIGLGFAELSKSPQQWKSAVQSSRDWLAKNPDDYYGRAQFLWSLLVKGTAQEIVGVIRQTSAWLASDPIAPPNQDGGWLSLFKKKLSDLQTNGHENSEFICAHLEDTLSRAAFLRYLRTAPRDSPLAIEFFALAQGLPNPLLGPSFFETISNEAQWLLSGLSSIASWIVREHANPFARLWLLWLTGRGDSEDKKWIAIEETWRWLKRNPRRSIVRWATVWLACACRDIERTGSFIDRFSEWLEDDASKGERMIRSPFLWLVGRRGNDPQVQRAFRLTERWLSDNPADDFVRIPYLLYLVGRCASPKKRKSAIRAANRWTLHHNDPQGLTAAAIELCKAAPDFRKY